MSNISISELLHPNLLTDQALREHLKNRQIQTPNIDQLTHEQLIELFSKYAMPLSQRTSGKASKSSVVTCTQSDPSPSKVTVQSRRIKRDRITGPDTYSSRTYSGHNRDVMNSMDAVIHASKKIKISSVAEENSNGLKRLFNNLEIEQTSPNSKRKKITWP